MADRKILKCSIRNFKIDGGNRRIPLMLLAPLDGVSAEDPPPAVLWIHGGGYMSGFKEMACLSRAADLVVKFGCVVLSPGYRKSVMNPYPAAIDDCYKALLWLRDNVKTLGCRSDQIMVGGESAGGGLCAALCMMARDLGSVRIAFQMPLYPMLDNHDTESSRDNHGRNWNTKRNHLGWKLYLRSDSRGEVSPYASPSRQKDFSGLPPCYTFVGDGEPFYSETVEYVNNLRAAGIEASLDVYGTDVHAFDLMLPALRISEAARENFCKAFRHAKEHYFAGND